MRPTTRYTDRMLYAAACKHRFNLEFNKDFRRVRQSDWYPANIKTLMAQVLWARDWALAGKKRLGEVDAFMAKLTMRWAERVRLDGGQFMSREDHEAVMECERAITSIERHYQTALPDAPRYVFRKLNTKRCPVVHRRVEYRLPSCASGRPGGPSRYTYACSLDRVVIENGEPRLTVRHFTSSGDPVAITRDLGLRFDVAGQLWAASKLLRRPVRVVEFEVVRTKAPSTPRALKCKSCKGEGVALIHDGDPTCKKCSGTGVGGLGVGACDTTWDIWKDTLAKYSHLNVDDHINRAGKVLDELRRRGETFAYRLHKEFTDKQIDDWCADTYNAIREIDRARKIDTWQRNPHVCNTRKAPCPYRAACAEVNQEPIFVKVSEDFPGIISWA